MKYVFTEDNLEAKSAQDAVIELEYQDLITIFDEVDFKDTSEVKPRSFSSMQLRAKNAVKALIRNANNNLLMISGSSNVDTIDLTLELLKDIANIEPTGIYALWYCSHAKYPPFRSSKMARYDRCLSCSKQRFKAYFVW